MNHELIVSNGPAIVDPNGGIFQPLAGSAIISVNAQNLRNGTTPYNPELQYLGLLRELVDKSDGSTRSDRTGVGTYSIFGRQIRFNLADGFPILTTKKVFFKGVVAELLWMLSGSTNIKPLTEQGVHIWDEWADENGELGPVYGAQWRTWKKHPDRIWDDIDQISQVIESIKTNPGSRRHIVTAWNPAEVEDMALPPCHMLFQFYVEDGKLSCQLYQRSADIFLGVPFNIAQYALLTTLIARECGLEVGEFVHTFGDLHLYSNHVDAAKEQLARSPKQSPTLVIAPSLKTSIFELTTSDVGLIGYDPHPTIKAKVAV